MVSKSVGLPCRWVDFLAVAATCGAILWCVPSYAKEGKSMPQQEAASKKEEAQQQQPEAAPQGMDNPTLYAPKVQPSELSRPYYYGFPGGTILLPPPDFRDPKGETIYQNYPFSPKEIEELRRFKMDIERAKTKPLIHPKMQSRAIQIDMSTGGSLPRVYIAPGYVTTLVLVDAAGKPWPLGANPILGDSTSFGISVADTARNIINLTASTTAARTTLSLVPESDQPVPIILEIEANAKNHDTRVDLLLPEYRNGSPELVDSAPRNPADNTMLAFVAGTPPDGAVAIEVSPVDAPIRAWYFDDAIYVRTTNRLVSPSWTGEASGVGGARVYRMYPTNSILYYQDGVVKGAYLGLDAIRFHKTAKN